MATTSELLLSNMEVDRWVMLDNKRFAVESQTCTEPTSVAYNVKTKKFVFLWSVPDSMSSEVILNGSIEKRLSYKNVTSVAVSEIITDSNAIFYGTFSFYTPDRRTGCIKMISVAEDYTNQFEIKYIDGVLSIEYVKNELSNINIIDDVENSEITWIINDVDVTSSIGSSNTNNIHERELEQLSSGLNYASIRALVDGIEVSAKKIVLIDKSIKKLNVSVYASITNEDKLTYKLNVDYDITKYDVHVYRNGLEYGLFDIEHSYVDIQNLDIVLVDKDSQYKLEFVNEPSYVANHKSVVIDTDIVNIYTTSLTSFLFNKMYFFNIDGGIRSNVNEMNVTPRYVSHINDVKNFEILDNGITKSVDESLKFSDEFISRDGMIGDIQYDLNKIGNFRDVYKTGKCISFYNSNESLDSSFHEIKDSYLFEIIGSSIHSIAESASMKQQYYSDLVPEFISFIIDAELDGINTGNVSIEITHSDGVEELYVSATEILIESSSGRTSINKMSEQFNLDLLAFSNISLIEIKINKSSTDLNMSIRDLIIKKDIK